MPESALLVVRRMQDPAPGRLDADHDAVMAPEEWRDAARAGLDRLYRAAARPALGPVPPTATAVLFLDRAELLACLGRDLLRGDIAGAWWWRAILRGMPDSAAQALLALWRAEARYVPGAVLRLLQWRLAADVVRTLPEAGAHAVAVAICRAYGADPARIAAPDGAAAPRVPAAEHSARPTTGRGAEPGRAPRARPPRDGPSAPPAGLVREDEAPRSLGPTGRLLMGVALAFGRAPLRARRPETLGALAAWARNGSTPETRRRPGTGQEPAADAQAGGRTPPPESRRVEFVSEPLAPHALESAPRYPRQGGERHQPDLEDVPPAGTPDAGRAAGPSRAPPDGGRVSGTPARAGTSGAAAPDAHAPRPLEIEAATPVRERAAPPATEEGAPTAKAAAPAPEAAHADTADAVAENAIEAVPTRLGGVLFLVNLFRALDLWRHLADTFRVRADCDGWGWIELVAAALLDPDRPALEGDPLWYEIRRLDGRDVRTAPWRGFRAGARYVLPDAWPAPPAALPDSRWSRGGHGGPKPRLVAPGGPGVRPRRALRRFLGFLMPYLRWRLTAALALPAGADLHDALFARPGRLWITSSHIDLYLSLEHATAPVRLAGLDLDPGWVPELGRVVLFHYE